MVVVAAMNSRGEAPKGMMMLVVDGDDEGRYW